MADFVRHLGASQPCKNEALLECTVLNVTRDRAAPVVATSFEVDYKEFGRYANLGSLVTRGMRVAQRVNSGIPKALPVALWLNQLCRLPHLDPNNPVSPINQSRLERIFAVLLPSYEDCVLLQMGRAHASETVTYKGFGNIMHPWSHGLGLLGIIDEKVFEVPYIHPPLTLEEKADAKFLYACRLAKIGSGYLYGSIPILGEDGPQPQHTHIIKPAQLERKLSTL